MLDGFPRQESLSIPDASIWMGSMGVPEYLILSWTPEPAVALGLTFDEVMNPDIAERLEQVEIVDADWLRRLAGRSLRAVAGPAPTTRVPKAPLEECWVEDVCGKAVAWPDSSWVIYIDTYDCGDYCYWGCSVYDTQTGRTADPTTLPRPQWFATPESSFAGCDRYPIAASGTAIAVNGQLCRAGECVPLGGQPLDFLDPGPTIVVGP